MCVQHVSNAHTLTIVTSIYGRESLDCTVLITTVVLVYNIGDFLLCSYFNYENISIYFFHCPLCAVNEAFSAGMAVMLLVGYDAMILHHPLLQVYHE